MADNPPVQQPGQPPQQPATIFDQAIQDIQSRLATPAVPLAGLTPAEERLQKITAALTDIRAKLNGPEAIRAQTGAQPAGPTRLDQFGNAVSDIGGAIAQGAQEGFGTAPLGPGYPQPDPGQNLPLALADSVSRPLLMGADFVLRGANAIWQGAVHGFDQTLQEMGVSRTTSRQLARDLYVLPDAIAPLTVMHPEASVRVGTTAIVARTVGQEHAIARIAELTDKLRNTPAGPERRQVALELRQAQKDATKVENIRASERAEKMRIRRARAINMGRKEAEMHAEAQQPGTGTMAAAEFDANVRAMDDVQVEALGLAIRSPDEILTDFPQFTTEVLTQEAMQKGLNAASRILQERGIDPTGLAPPRIYEIVQDLLRTGNVDYGGFGADMQAAGMPKQQYIQLLGVTASDAGRTLQKLRMWREQLRGQALKGDQDAQEWLRTMAEESGQMAERSRQTPRMLPGEIAAPYLTRASRLFRQLLISLPVTAVRNYIDSGGFRTFMNVAQRSVDITMRKVFAPGDVDITAPYDWSGEVGRIFNPTSAVKAKKQLDFLFKAYPEVQNRVFSSLEADVARRHALDPSASKFDKIESAVFNKALALNRAQEFIIRRATFAAALDSELKKVGSSLQEVVDYGIKPAGLSDAMAKASEHALFTTFALDPAASKGRLGKLFTAYAKLIDESRVLPFLEPFPRFFFNQAKLILEYQPTGGLRLISAKARGKMLEGNFEPFGREMVGAMMFGTAIAIRTGHFPGVTPGPKWDEAVTSKGNVFSMAPFASLAPYLYLADLAIRSNEGRIKPDSDQFKELVKGLRGSAPQLAQGNQAISDIVNMIIHPTERTLSNAADYGGQILAGYARPLALLHDIVAEFDDAWKVQRETRGQGITAPIMALVNPTSLPPRESPTQQHPPTTPDLNLPFGMGKVGAGVMSQFSGVRAREPRNAIQNQLNYLGFTSKDLSPKSGDKRFDALIAKGQGVFLEDLGDRIVHTQAYLALDIKARTEYVRNMLAVARDVGRQVATVAAPATATNLHFRRMVGTKREAWIAATNRALKSAGVDFTAEDKINEMRQAMEEELRNLHLGGSPTP